MTEKQIYACALLIMIVLGAAL